NPLRPRREKPPQTAAWRGQRGPRPSRSFSPPANCGSSYRVHSVEVAPGVFRLELPMPFELRHVNVYLVRDGDRFTLIDTGLRTDESRQALAAKLAALQGPADPM